MPNSNPWVNLPKKHGMSLDMFLLLYLFTDYTFAVPNECSTAAPSRLRHRNGTDLHQWHCLPLPFVPKVLVSAERMRRRQRMQPRCPQATVPSRRSPMRRTKPCRPPCRSPMRRTTPTPPPC